MEHGARDPAAIGIRRYPDHTVWEIDGDTKVRFLGTARYVGVSTNVKLESALHNAVREMQTMPTTIIFTFQLQNTYYLGTV